MMVASVALLRQEPEPDETAITRALGGVLCRCTGYRKIIDAVASVPAALADVGGPGHAGASIRRLDGAEKLAGTEAFGDDVAPPDTLEILVIRSPFPRAAFHFGDLEAWRAGQMGIEAVLTAAVAMNPSHGQRQTRNNKKAAKNTTVARATASSSTAGPRACATASTS